MDEEVIYLVHTVSVLSTVSSIFCAVIVLCLLFIAILNIIKKLR